MRILLGYINIEVYIVYVYTLTRWSKTNITKCSILTTSFIGRLLLARLPESLNSVLNSAITFVNCVKSSALNTRILKVLFNELNSDHGTLLFLFLYRTEVRWLSKGNMLGRMFSLQSEIEIFLTSTGKLNARTSKHWEPLA